MEDLVVAGVVVVLAAVMAVLVVVTLGPVVREILATTVCP
jgi:hypothetical protein